MQSLDVYKYINTLVRNRRDDLAQGREETENLNRTFKGSDANIHVFTGYNECLQILKDKSFVQPRIADAITEVFQTLGGNIQPIEIFLRNNLIEMNGARHEAAKPAFVREYGITHRRLADDLPRIGRTVFEDFVNGKKTRILSDLVEPYVDAVIETVFNGVGRKNWEGQASCIFEYMHSGAKLKKKARQVARLASQIRPKSEDDDDVRSAVVLLTYVLQGRDPLIGGLSDYMHSLVAMNEDERRASVAATTARDLFWRTSPVNYIGRLATKAASIGGVDVDPGDRVLLLLPCANHDSRSSSKGSVAFGAGAHICPGQTIALAIGDVWLSELKSQYIRISWDDIKPDRPVTAVFRQYKDRSRHANER